jgi:2-polyprenyl-6-methoxyphenol hydroxylase-like FAD-dependent oxidoreductase
MATPPRRVLISGLSIAGPVAAYWLARSGAEVTVVERSATVRDGGYPIDIRGAANDVLKRMGVYEVVKQDHISTETVHFISASGKELLTRRNSVMAGHVEGQDIEVPRGVLTAGLMSAAATCDIEYLFSNSIQTLVETPHLVDVTFADGTERSFDIVIGNDGQHSNVRELAFGPEAKFDRYMGWCFSGFTMPNPRGYHHEVLLYNKPGLFATIYAVGNSDRVYGFLACKSPRPTYENARDIEWMRNHVLGAWEGIDAWEIPALRDGLRSADDVFADTVNQIHMPSWSRGRVVVAGDAAAAPSFLTGQGTSVALVGAYVLAKEIARHDDHVQAFRAYESATRAFVTTNQTLADGRTRTTILDRRRDIWRRNMLLRALPLVRRLGGGMLFGGRVTTASDGIDLSGYHDDLATSTDN